MQVTATDEAAKWASIAKLSRVLAVRTPDSLFQDLMAEENLLKEVRLTGLLRSNRTYDMAGVTFIGVTPSPLTGRYGALDAEQRAANAAVRADAAAQSSEGSANRVEKAIQRMEAAADTVEGQFNTGLRK